MSDAKKLFLAMNAAARVVEDSKRFHDDVYVRCAGDENDGEISYLEAAKILRIASSRALNTVRHGRWIVKDNPNWRAYSIHECSLCGYYVHDTKLTKRDTMRYCQNCGAKMDEGVTK